MVNSYDTNEDPMWKSIMEKLKPYLTRDDFITMDKDRFAGLINRLRDIHELTEQEHNYAKINRDLILIRMGLIHNLPDVTDEMLEDILKQLSVHLASLYFNENIAKSWSDAQKRVLDLISKGFGSKVMMGLSPESHIENLRKELNQLEQINLFNKEDVVKLIEDKKDKLMQAGISGVKLHKLTQYCQKLKRAKKEELPNKHEIIEETFVWEEMIK